MKRATVLLATATIGAMGLALGLTPASGTKGVDNVHAIKFGVPRIVDPVHTYGEPDIKVAPNGTVYVSGPQGTGVQRSIWNASYDNGDSYRLVQDNKTGSAPASSTQPTKSTMGPGGGDTEIIVDKHNNVYYADLYALACFTTAYSGDNGKTVHSTPLGCASPGADRQWFGVYDPLPSDHTISPYKGPKPIVYMKYTSGTSGSKIDYTDGSDPTNWHQGDSAAVIADQSPYSPTDAPVVVLTAVGVGNNGLALAVGEPAKDGSAHLNFKYETIVPNLPGDPNTLFPGFTMDKDRNLYVSWVQDNDYQVYYSWAHVKPSGTDWGKWSKPIKVNRPPSATNLMPWMEGGKGGIVDMVWYGTNLTPKQLGPDGPSAQKNQAWYAWFAQIDHAASASPHIVQSQASQHPMHYNDICMLGTACITAQGNRNLADFFEVTIDNQGRARIVYTDTSNNLSGPTGAVPAADHSGAPLVTTSTQMTGLNAWTGKPLKATESQKPRLTVNDPIGDARYPVLGGAKVDGADIEHVLMEKDKKYLDILVTLRHGTLADAATAAKAPYGRLVVRWQMGKKLYHAGVDEDAAGTSRTFYAGKTQSTDSCSVSACDPHNLDYVAPPLSGAVSAPGRAKVGQNTIYKIRVPLDAIGNPKDHSLLQSVEAYVFAAPFPGSEQNSKEQTDLDEVPLELDGTKSFNFSPYIEHGTNPDNGMLSGGFALALPLPLAGVLMTGLTGRRRRRPHGSLSA
jgi:hypothetical protein